MSRKKGCLAVSARAFIRLVKYVVLWWTVPIVLHIVLELTDEPLTDWWMSVVVFHFGWVFVAWLRCASKDGE